MAKLHITLFLCLAFATITYAMEQQEQELTSIEIHEQQLSAALKQMPEDLGTHIVCLQLQDIHNQVNTIKEARNYLVSVSLVNKYCNQLATNPANTITLIRNLSQTIHLSGGSASMADLLNTPETRNYNIQSKQLFSKELTPEKIDELVHAGADVNYTFSPCNNGYYSYVLKHWISEKHYNNVEKLLKIGADVNTPNGECAAIQSAICTNNANIVALVLSYKPHEIHLYYPMYLRQHGGSPHSRDDIILLLLAATKERPNNQKELNLALQHAIGASSENIPLLLEAGAEPECALQHLLSWKFRNLADHKNTAGTPSLDILQLLCNYPVSDMERVMHARDLLKNIMENAQQALKILDSCTTKLEGLQQ